MYKDSIRNLANDIRIKDSLILITGATGLIGSCIVDVLIQANKESNANNRIYALGRDINKLKQRFGKEVFPLVQSIEYSLDDSTSFDYIFHCASNADPKSYSLHPVGTILTNIVGNKNMLDYCVSHKSTRMITTSSFEVYGEIEGVDIYSEEMSGVIDQTILRNGYPESKRCSELLLRSYVDEYGVNAVIARLSSVYGPTMQQNDSKAHAQFIRNAINNENIVLKSKGEQRRTYSYVIDIVDGLFTILLKGKNGDIYNLANDNSIASIAEVAETCAKLAGTKVIFEVPDEIEAKGFSRSKNCILNCKKLRELGWEGHYSLEAGLKETIDYLRENDVR